MILPIMEHHRDRRFAQAAGQSARTGPFNPDMELERREKELYESQVEEDDEPLGLRRRRMFSSKVCTFVLYTPVMRGAPFSPW